MDSQQFSINYNNECIGVSGGSGLYTLTFPGNKNILIEQCADGWYQVQQSEKRWTDHDISMIGKIIEYRNSHA